MSCVFVSANPAFPTKAILPPSIKCAWVSDLTALALQDIRQGLFGARRHELGEYTLVYRLDISPSMLQAITMTGKGVFTYPIDFPGLCDVIESTKVWLLFDEDNRIQKKRAALPTKISNRVLRTTIPVSFSKPTAQDSRLPSDLKMQWRHSLTTLFLDDLRKGLFGARRHLLSCDRSITYRVDVCENILKQVAKSPGWTFEDDDDKPTINELLGCAKIWLSFPESQAANTQKANGREQAENNTSHPTDVYDVTAPMPTTPASPTPSDVTLVDDNLISPSIPNKSPPKAIVSPSQSPRVKVSITPPSDPSMGRIREGFFYGDRSADLASYRRSLGLPPLVPRRRRVDLLTMLKNAVTGKPGRPDAFAFGVHRDIEEWGNGV